MVQQRVLGKAVMVDVAAAVVTGNPLVKVIVLKLILLKQLQVLRRILQLILYMVIMVVMVVMEEVVTKEAAVAAAVPIMLDKLQVLPEKVEMVGMDILVAISLHLIYTMVFKTHNNLDNSQLL